jgi:hypothetical protein
MTRRIRTVARLTIAGATALAILALQVGSVFAGGRIP